ncbi:MAG TPA: hypothetical protein PK029_03525, partial [Bacteroidales bacterium]|nr:hypothetical protein [Bacteroidales bacterium]
MKFIVFVLLNVLLSSFSLAQDTTTIYACDIEYANKRIDVYKYSDYFTKIEEKVGSFSVDSTGCFTFS